MRVTMNGNRTCICRAQLIEHWSGRSIQVEAPAYRWQPDQDGQCEVEFRIPGPNGMVKSERGYWVRLKSGVLEKPDRRRLYYPSMPIRHGGFSH